MTDRDRARQLLRAARMILAWDAMKTEVKEFTTLKSLVNMGGQVANLAKLLSEHYFKDNANHLKEAAAALQGAYLGTAQLKHGLPVDHVAKIQAEVQHYVQQITSHANQEARKYGGDALLGASMALLPVSSMAAVLVKSSLPYWGGGATALRELKNSNGTKEIPTPVKGAQVTAAHDEAMLKHLFTQVLPWLAGQSAVDGKSTYPSQELQKQGTTVGLHFAKEAQTTLVDDDLVSQYRAKNVDSLRALLTFCAFAVAILDLEVLEQKLEQKARTYVQSMLTKIRQSEQDKRKEEKQPATEPGAAEPGTTE